MTAVVGRRSAPSWLPVVIAAGVTVSVPGIVLSVSVAQPGAAGITEWPQTRAVVFAGLGMLTLLVGLTGLWRLQQHQSVRHRTGIALLLLGYLLTLLGAVMEFLFWPDAPAAAVPSSLLTALAAPFLITALLLLCWPQRGAPGLRRRALIDLAVGFLGLLVLWMALVAPGHTYDGTWFSAFSAVAVSLSEFATISVVLLVASLTRIKTDLPIIQAILLQLSVGVLAAQHLLSSFWLLSKPTLVMTAALVALSAALVLALAFLGRRSSERELARHLWMRDIWSTFVPLSPVAVAAALLLFILGTGDPSTAASAAVAVALLLLIAAIIWLRMLATLSVRRATVSSMAVHFDAAEQQGWFQVLTRQSREMVVVVDEQTRIVYLSHPLVRVLGLEGHDVRGRYLNTVLPGVTRDDLLDALETSDSGIPVQIELSVVDHAGRDHDLQFLVSALHSSGTDGYVLTGSDITDARRLRTQLGESRRRDSLTGLLNRDGFISSIAEAQDWVAPTRLAVVVIDLVDFRAINDTRGHDVGDILLRRFADLLEGLDAPVVAVARLGGDEFGVLLRSSETQAAAEHVAETSKNGMSAVRLPDGSHVGVRAAVGYAQLLSATDSAATLVEHADLAAAVSNAEHQQELVRYEPRMKEDLNRRFLLFQNVREAIENREFVPFYQPIIELDSGRVWGVEALARRRLPTGELISPEEFIPSAERLGLVGRIDAMIHRQALEDVADLQSITPGLCVSINVAPMELTSELLPGLVEQIVGSRLPADRVVVEFTESTVAENEDVMRAVISRLHRVGAWVALDDFGTGYSSLSGLSDLDVDVIKVDQSFVRRVATDARAIAIFRSIVALGRNLGLHTLAEGVRSTEQADILRGLGCDRAQGYLFGAPMSRAELEDWLAAGGVTATKDQQR
ncbi:MAG: EAL domain-containing protein [Actinobacteria bacterium]|nr:EAL domain-containing protein [Actinomycetota bacterium]